MHCYQLASSSLKNCPNDKQGKDIEIASKFCHASTQHTNKLKELFPWLPIASWQNWVYLILPTGSEIRVHPEPNIGLVMFENGKPTLHTLLNHEQLVYPLPDCTTFTMP